MSNRSCHGNWFYRTVYLVLQVVVHLNQTKHVDVGQSTSDVQVFA